MCNIRRFFVRQLNYLRNWWLSREDSSINNEHSAEINQLQEQIDISTDYEQDYAGVYITNVRLGYGTIWIRNMMSPYGHVVRIAALRFVPGMWSYLVVYANQEQAERALAGVQNNRPLFAQHFRFHLVPHRKLVNTPDIVNIEPNNRYRDVTD